MAGKFCIMAGNDIGWESRCADGYSRQSEYSIKLILHLISQFEDRPIVETE